MTMKPSAQILLLIALLTPVLAGAREETMEERKQRIMRKYLRERAEITYSEMSLPDEEAEGKEILASEKFKQPQVDFQRQGGGAAIPPPVMRRPAPRVENSNWLLSETSEQDDPYADPFARKNSSDVLNAQTDRTGWDSQNTSFETETPRESRYDRGGGSQTWGYGTAQQGFFNPKDPRTPSSESMWSTSQQEGSVWGSRSPFGRQQEIQRPASMNTLDLSREKTFNSPLNQTQLENPFPSEVQLNSRRSEFRTGRQTSSGVYTPYKSSFQTQREQRQQQWKTHEETQPVYQKQNTFQQWKERNPVRYDPTADDAFIQEMMPKVRR